MLLPWPYSSLTWIHAYLSRADQNHDDKMSYDEIRMLLQMINIDLSEQYAHSLFQVMNRTNPWGQHLPHKSQVSSWYSLTPSATACLTRPHSSHRSVTSQLMAAWTTGRSRFSAGSCYGGQSSTPFSSATLPTAASSPLWTWGISWRIRERTPHPHTPRVSSWPTSSTSGVRLHLSLRLCKVRLLSLVWFHLVQFHF